jgi:hypothetical protein
VDLESRSLVGQADHSSLGRVLNELVRMVVEQLREDLVLGGIVSAVTFGLSI